MAQTLATIYNRTLRRLGVLARGQTATAEDTADMVNAYAEVWARLDKRHLAYWDDDDSVPNEHVNDVVALMAKSRLDDYGVDGERRVSILSDASQAEYNIAKITASPKTGETEHEDF
jgi:hypothetical protein